MTQSLWRSLLYKELAQLNLVGSILDLGGSRNSKYHMLIKGEHAIQVNNLEGREQAEYEFDLEQPFPIKNDAFDHLLCINVLEHVFDYQNVLNESHRILKQGGTLVVAVPFLIRYHPSPNDYWRYTETTLQKITTKAGFSSVIIKPVGTGVFGASYSLIHNLIHFGFLQKLCILVARKLDGLLQMVFKTSTYTKKNYPLGFVIVARK